MALYVMTPKIAPWGDFGRVLVHGLSAHLPRRDGLIQLERTGPFIPPLSFPGVADVIVTTPMRSMLEAAHLAGVSFKLVCKARVTRVVWTDWNREKPPAFVPPSGKPEDYILSLPDDRALADAMGDLWELDAQTVGSARRELAVGQPSKYRFIVTVPPSTPDVFHSDGLRYMFVTSRARDFFNTVVPDVTEFSAVELAN